MSNEDFVWTMAFEDTESYETVAQYLVERGHFDECNSPEVLCPDDVPRPALVVPYDVYRKAKTMRVDSKPLNFVLLRQRKAGGTMEIWPPGQKFKAGKKEEPVAAAAKDTGPPPF